MADRRADLLIELTVDTAGVNSYSYTGDWIATDEVNSVRIRCTLDGVDVALTVELQESIDQTLVVSSVTVPSDTSIEASELTVSARYFRIVASATASNSNHDSTWFQLCVRKAS